MNKYSVAVTQLLRLYGRVATASRFQVPEREPAVITNTFGQNRLNRKFTVVGLGYWR